jgi:hypothetical protein
MSNWQTSPQPQAGMALGAAGTKEANGPGFLAQLRERRTRLLEELRDVEQAMEALEANPQFEVLMQRILRAHRL